MEEIEETRINLLGCAAIGILMLLGSIYSTPELSLEKGEIYEEPVLHKYSKASEIVFSIKHAKGYGHKIRSIYHDLKSWQKDRILSLKKGDFVALLVNKNRIYQNRKEALTITINQEVIYSLTQYEAFKRREKVGCIVWTILFLSLYFIYTKSKWMENGCLIWLLATIGMFLVLLFFFW